MIDEFDVIILTICGNNINKNILQKLIHFHTVTIPSLNISDLEVTIALESMCDFDYIRKNIKNYEITEKGLIYFKFVKEKYPNEF